VSPILGIWASQNYVRITGSYDSIATSTSGGSTTTFSSIPSTYKHLQIRISGTLAANGDGVIRFNNDTTNGNYTTHQFYGTGNNTSGSADFLSGSSYPPYYDFGVGAGNPYAAIIDILDYSSTSKNKVIKTFVGWDANGSGRIGLCSNSWMNTAAVNRIDFTNRNYSSGTVIALYGIKG
jgi:hypothetical protein